MNDGFLDLLVVPEWREHYVPYQHLRKCVEDLASQLVPSHVDLKYRRKSLTAEAASGNPQQQQPQSPLGQHNFGAASFSYRQDTAASFAGTITLAGNGSLVSSSSAMQLNIHVVTRLTPGFELEIQRVEWRLGKRGAVHSEAVSGSEMYRQLLEHRDEEDAGQWLAGSLSALSGADAAEIGALCTARQVVWAVSRFNTAAMEAIRPFVDKAGRFYESKARELSAVAAACLEVIKLSEQLSSAQHDALRDTMRKLHHSLQRLQEFCDANFLVTSRLLDDIHAASHQYLDSHDVLRGLVFANPPNTGPVFMLRQLVVQRVAEAWFEGREDAASKSLALQDDIVEATVREPLLLGLVVGATLATLVSCLVKYNKGENGELPHLGGNHTSDGFMFATSGIIISLAVAFALNVIIWERHRVNYVFSLHLNPLRHFTGISLLSSNCMYALLWSICLYCYFVAAESELSADNQVHAMERLVSVAASSQLSLVPANLSACSRWNTTATCLTHPTAACCPPLAAILGPELLQDVAATYHPTFPSWVWPYLVYPVCLIWWVVDLLYSSQAAAAPRHQHHHHRHRGDASSPSGGAEPHRRQCLSIDSWLLRTLLRVLRTPFLPVEFPDFFICEQLVSLSTTLYELQFAWCFFHTPSNEVNNACDMTMGWNFFLLLIMPNVWRALQSARRYLDEPFERHFYPHVLNGLKASVTCLSYAFYSSTKLASFTDASNGTRTVLLVLFIVFSSIDSVFKSWYELWVEFGLLRTATTAGGSKKATSSPPLLRHSLLYHPSLYYVSIAVTVLVRLVWIGKVFAEATTPKQSSGWIYPTFAAVEILRRFLWNCVRVENDQVSNTESYKLVKLAPSVHAAATSVALWDVKLDQFVAQMEGNEECRIASQLVTSNSKMFFRGLSASERVALLTTVLEATPVSPEGSASGGSAAVSFAETPSHSGAATGSGEPFPVLPPERSASKRSSMFFRDPRTGLLKTSVRLFDELHSEDRCRAVLLRIGSKRTLRAYLSQLVATKDIDLDTHAKLLIVVVGDGAGTGELQAAGVGSPLMLQLDPSIASPYGAVPQRSASFLRRMGSSAVKSPETHADPTL